MSTKQAIKDAASKPQNLFCYVFSEDWILCDNGFA